MTFIASVKAKKGVAIIADSLVTSTPPILHYGDFIDYLEGKPENEHGEKTINLEEILDLFDNEPIYTKDYEEKLFKLNDYTAITVTGMAYLNDMNMADLIETFKANNADISDLAISFESKINQFKTFLTEHVKEHLVKHQAVNYTLFILTFYERHTHKTHICEVTIRETFDDSLKDDTYEYVDSAEQLDWITVVCEGQNKISEKVLYGTGRELFDIFNIFVQNIINELNLPEGTVPDNFIEELKNKDYFKTIFYQDFELLNLQDLSLQQAVDLASLLMRLEVDFQKYTKNVPTVGGVIKLAIITEEGFDFLTGDKMEVPKHINY